MNCFQKNSPLRRELEPGKLVIRSTDQANTLPGSIAECFQDHDIQLSILAPMMILQSAVGVLGVAVTDPPQDFLLRQVDLVERMAFDLASLTQAAILLDQALALAAVDERNRLARDLHHLVTQVLFSATLVAEVLPQIWRHVRTRGSKNWKSCACSRVAPLLKCAPCCLSCALPAVINIPLSDLLVQLAEAVTSRSGLPFQFFIEQIPILPESVHVDFYRIAQEALNNVVKHSQAKLVTLSLSKTPSPRIQPARCSWK